MALFTRSIDPKIIENTYSVQEQDFEEYEDDRFDLESLKEYLGFLPLKEVDLIEMYFTGRKKQKEIADFFNVSQGAISHRISRAKKRLIFLRDMPKISDDILRANLKSIFHDVEVDIIFYMIKTTCQSKTADLVNEKHDLGGKSRLTQVKVRHKFDRALERVRDKSLKEEKYTVIADLIKHIKENLYMLHEVKLPHFDKGKKVSLYED